MILGECKAGHIVEDMETDVLSWYDRIIFIRRGLCLIIIEEVSQAPAWFSKSCQVLSWYQRIVSFFHEARFIFVEERA